ncbi:hypothetical protein PAEPH01_0824 [Pancytospora epiphaga]|nr:hypothetical protein PAEPH01_0824 [Pancytospora epiphaga]
MCGILWSEEESRLEEIVPLLKRRGPSFFHKDYYFGRFFASSVLYIRGATSQPVIGNGYILQYNGEIYNDSESDTLYIKTIVDRVLSCADKTANNDLPSSVSQFTVHREVGIPVTYRDSASGPVEICCNDSKACSPEEIPDKFIRPDNRSIYIAIQVYLAASQSEGEFAISISLPEWCVFFKDDIGRRSLGISFTPFTLSSLGYHEELDPLKIYIYDFTHKCLFSIYKPETSFLQVYFSLLPLVKNFNIPYAHGCGITHPISNGLPVASQFNQSIPEKYKEPIDLVINTFKTAVERRLPDDGLVVGFSGGVDSTLVALFVHLTALNDRPIYLVNTSFPDSFDRRSGRASHQALCKLTPIKNRFILIENDLYEDEIKMHRDRINLLISPKTTQMHSNIGAVLYFTGKTARNYGKTLYLGSGADEVFGGYNKYSRSTEYSKDTTLPDFRIHMLYDLFTISAHNLCRDDRVIGDWGIETRFPFLDRSLIKLTFYLDSSYFIRKNSSGVTNKSILRDILHRYGLVESSLIPKKAMQYGAGISRVEKRT